jgi:hypothetical protein
VYPKEGQLLFNLFICDLSIILNAKSSFFLLDDLKIFHEIKTLEDAQYLQNKLNDINLNHWCKFNKLKLNVEKCHSISFPRKPVKIQELVVTTKTISFL